MLKVDFVRPSPGILVDLWPDTPDYHSVKPRVAAEVTEAVFSKSPTIQDATLFGQVLPAMFSHDDTTAPKESVRFRRLGAEGFGVDLGSDFTIGADDGSMRQGEEVIMPLHNTTLIFAGLHYRTRLASYCTALVTTELETLQCGQPPERPLFVWIG